METFGDQVFITFVGQEGPLSDKLKSFAKICMWQINRHGESLSNISKLLQDLSHTVSSQSICHDFSHDVSGFVCNLNYFSGSKLQALYGTPTETNVDRFNTIYRVTSIES